MRMSDMVSSSLADLAIEQFPDALSVWSETEGSIEAERQGAFVALRFVTSSGEAFVRLLRADLAELLGSHIARVATEILKQASAE